MGTLPSLCSGGRLLSCCPVAIIKTEQEVTPRGLVITHLLPSRPMDVASQLSMNFKPDSTATFPRYSQYSLPVIHFLCRSCFRSFRLENGVVKYWSGILLLQFPAMEPCRSSSKASMPCSLSRRAVERPLGP